MEGIAPWLYYKTSRERKEAILMASYIKSTVFFIVNNALTWATSDISYFYVNTKEIFEK